MKNTKHRKHALLIQPTLQLKYKKLPLSHTWKEFYDVN